MTATARPAEPVAIENIQSRPNYKTIVDASVTPNQPLQGKFYQGLLPTQPQAAIIICAGEPGKFSGVCVGGNGFAPPPNWTGNFVDEVEFVLSDGALKFLAGLEFDIKATNAAGYTGNGSSQLDFNTVPGKMLFSVAKADGTWESIGVEADLPDESSYHTLARTGYFDQSAGAEGAGGTLSFDLDGAVYPVPKALQSVPASKVGWAENELVDQAQLSMNETPGAVILTIVRRTIYLW